MQQTDKINYRSTLTHRGYRVGKDADEDHRLDKNQLANVENMINEYVAMKAREKEAENKEFMVGSAA